jgi:hypothetical protein
LKNQFLEVPYIPIVKVTVIPVAEKGLATINEDYKNLREGKGRFFNGQ